jgi:hypothetical protein
VANQPASYSMYEMAMAFEENIVWQAKLFSASYQLANM